MLRSTHSQQKGLSLIEVMVGLVIGILVILAAGSALILGTKQQRATVATSNLGQDTTFIHSFLDQTIRSAGTGFLHGNSWSPLGCAIHAQRGQQLLLPIPSDAPAFLGSQLKANVLPLAPILIAEGLNQNHVIMTMSGSPKNGGAPQEILGSELSDRKISLSTSLGLENGDLTIISSAIPKQGSTDNQPNCYVSQVDSIDSNNVKFSEDFFPSTPVEEGETAESPIGDLIDQVAFVSTLGHIENGTSEMSIIGVDNENNLQQLRLMTQESDVLASNVVALRALYGISDGAGNITWTLPQAPDDLPGILNKSRAERAAWLRKIAAIRISLLIKSTHAQGEGTTESTVTHFKDLASNFQYSTTIKTEDQKYTHQLLEFTVPLRNALFPSNLVNATN